MSDDVVGRGAVDWIEGCRWDVERESSSAVSVPLLRDLLAVGGLGTPGGLGVGLTRFVG